MFQENQVWKLHDDFSIRLMPDAEFQRHVDKHAPKFFDEKSQVFRFRDALSTDEMEKLKQLRASSGDAVVLRLGLFKGDMFIGWNFSRQEQVSSLYMQTSAVFPEYRRTGLYSELVKKVTEIGREAGFLSITSRHVSTNNAVIIAKLKLGFKITGLELTDTFGTLVNLTYFSNPIREKILDYRAGFTKPDAEIKRLLKI